MSNLILRSQNNFHCCGRGNTEIAEGRHIYIWYKVTQFSSDRTEMLIKRVCNIYSQLQRCCYNLIYLYF